MDPEVVRCVEQVVSECERAGHELIEASPVFDYEEYPKGSMRKSLGLRIVCRDRYVRRCDGADNQRRDFGTSDVVILQILQGSYWD